MIVKYHYTYITTNKINGKQYVGDRTTENIENDKYIGSGTYFKNAVKKYGKVNFSKLILETFPTRIESYRAQEKYIKMFNTLSPNGYNISPKGGNKENGCCSEETKKKIGEKSANRSAESNYRCGSTNRGKETWMKGKHHTEESNELNRQKHVGKKHTEESKIKIGISSSNRIFRKSFYQIWTEKYGIEEANIRMKNWKEKVKITGEKHGMFGKNLYQIWTEKYGIEEADIKMKNWKEKVKRKPKNKIKI